MSGQEVSLPQFTYTRAGVEQVLNSAQDLSQAEKDDVLSIFDSCDTHKYENGKKVEGKDQKLDAEEEESFFAKIGKKYPGILIAFEYLKDKFLENEAKKMQKDAKYNDKIQKQASKYNKEDLKKEFNACESYKYEVKQGDTLYSIAKKALKEEGKDADGNMINKRIAEMVAVNGIKDINSIAPGTQLLIYHKDSLEY